MAASSPVVSIVGLDKGRLLELLVQGTRFLAFMPEFMSYQSSETEASKRVTYGYIDYYQGKAIKMDLRSDFQDGINYNRDAGAGAFQKIIAYMRLEEEAAIVKPDEEKE